MLILTRKPGGAVIVRVGDTVIEVKVVDVRGRQISLGFGAPKNVQVNREEIDKRIYGNNKVEKIPSPVAAAVQFSDPTQPE